MTIRMRMDGGNDMLRLGRAGRVISVMLIAVLMLGSMSTFAASSKGKATAKIKGANYPKTITAGKGFKIKGKIVASKKITRVEIGVTSKGGGKWTAQKYDKRKINSKSFNVSKANKKLKFNKLEAGSYYYRIYVHTTDKKVKVVLNKKFTVKAKGKPYATDCTYPTELINGESFTIKGTVRASETIKKVEVGVVSAKTGKWTTQRYTNSPKSKKFSVKKADPYIKFGQLANGKYCYRINATTASGTTTVLSKSFTVRSEDSEDEDVNDGIDCNIETSDGVSITDGNLPSNYKVGKAFTVKGTIQSKEDIDKVEIGIVFEPTNKWTKYKYTQDGVNAKTFDISKAAEKLSFDKLPGGNFRYRIYAHTASGVKIVLDYPFKVTPSNKPQAAVNWAINIANDDTFTYGKKPKANAIGCYFCGTNHGPVKYNKPKGYEKTYVCLTFIGAAYAHGANDPEILDKCQHAKMTMYETDDNFKVFSCWMKLGSCKELTVDDLQVGDVIIKWSDKNDNNGHVWMYMGGDNYVDSRSGGGDGWGAETIAVRTGASAYLKQLSSNSKNYVMRYTK